ncbi:hypothetical protein DENIS_4647 [Desulfonema ishimotonii]|uniref:histidine kinase n=1 Tax=Desulfonema ishimotonii TaxID=45657 RepID=A0A401G326_9BACT|nr:ATP-binding protein [Desulfonema ishimotonii]GBC63649.1 hypothetical protein DENIS_4647 [Desulfonema ishimotonii]
MSEKPTYQQLAQRVRVLEEELKARDLLEQALRKNHMFTRKVLNTLSPCIAVLGRAGEILTANRAWRDFLRDGPFDLPPDTATCRNFFQIISGADDSGSRHLVSGLRDVLSGAGSFFEAEYVCPGLTPEKWLLFHASAFDGPEDGAVISFSDVTRLRAVQVHLKRHIAFEDLVTSVSTRFINLPVCEIDHGIRDALGAIGRNAGVDRSTVLLFSEDRTRLCLTHRWCAGGIAPIDATEIETRPPFDTFADAILKNKVVRIPGPDACHQQDTESADLSALFARHGVKSAIAVPMTLGDSVIGVLGFDSIRSEKAWTENSIRLLRIVGEIFVNALARQRAEERLRKYEMIFSTTSNPIAFIDRDYRFRVVNDACSRNFDRQRDELVGQPVAAFFGTGVFETVIRPPCERCLAGEEVRYQAWFDFPSRGLRYMDVACSPFSEADGTVSGVVINALDQTGNRQTADALREKDARFRQLAENINDVFWLISADMAELFYVSPAYETIWGRSRDPLYADPAASWLEAVHPDDRAGVARRIAAGDFPGEDEYDFECRIIRPDGKVRWICNRVFPIRGTSGTVSRLARVTSDITEKKRLLREAALRRQQVIQADRLSALGQVVAGVAHEINNPNSFITYNIPLLEETWEIFEPVLSEYADRHPDLTASNVPFRELIEDMGEIIRSVRTGSERINRVVSDLKDFARTDKEGAHRPLSVNRVIEKTLTIVGAQLRNTVGRVELALAENLPDIRGHFQKLEQVVANLLVNASQAVTDKMKGRISVSTRCIGRLGAVIIEVEDNGKGMTPAVTDRIFEPFFTTRQRHKGTGLGLSVSYGLIREHHGTIGVLSKPGAGSRFTVWLPAGRAEWSAPRPAVLLVKEGRCACDKLQAELAEAGEPLPDIIDAADDIPACLTAHPEVDTVVIGTCPPAHRGLRQAEIIRSRFPLLTVLLWADPPGSLQHVVWKGRRPDHIFESIPDAETVIGVMKKIGRQRL